MCIFLYLEPGVDLFLGILNDLVVGMQGDMEHITNASCLEDDICGVAGDDFSLDVIEHITEGANIAKSREQRVKGGKEKGGKGNFVGKF